MAKHFERYAEVAEILIRHGFGSIAPLLGLGQVHLGPPLLRVGTRATPEQLVVTLEELGPTFIKLGQLLSTRPDVLPRQHIAALARLQDDVPPLVPEQVRTIIEQELGASPTLLSPPLWTPLSPAPPSAKPTRQPWTTAPRSS
ncbi:hypothetical protein NHF46_08085 [Arthrobacter alpinus]|nr:hypothetical protein [Arthrobacter alpinus]